MSIKFQFRNSVYVVSIGYGTDWFKQLSLITITKEYYEKMNVVYAEMVYHS